MINAALVIARVALTGDWSALAKLVLRPILMALVVQPAAFHDLVAKAEESLGIIIDDPIKFLPNLLDSVPGGISNFADDTPSPTVDKVVGAKTKKYRPLFDLMTAQSFTRKRTRIPMWMPCIVSNACEFSPAVFELVEKLAVLVKRKYSLATRPLDGFTPSAAAADFRTRFKDEIASTVGSGFAMMLQASASAAR